LVDCTSEFSIEQSQCGQGFTEAVWVVKLMIGAVDPSYDLADEQQSTVPMAQAVFPPNQNNPNSIFDFGFRKN
jgi:hypothetical protein